MLIYGDLLISPSERMAMALPFRNDPHCDILTSILNIDFDGSIEFCCGVYEPTTKVANSFLDISVQDIQERRKKALFCRQCQSIGNHKFGEVCRVENPAFANLLRQRLTKNGLPEDALALCGV